MTGKITDTFMTERAILAKHFGWVFRNIYTWNSLNTMESANEIHATERTFEIQWFGRAELKLLATMWNKSEVIFKSFEWYNKTKAPHVGPFISIPNSDAPSTFFDFRSDFDVNRGLRRRYSNTPFDTGCLVYGVIEAQFYAKFTEISIFNASSAF